MLKALLPLIEQIELAGKVERLKSNVIAGIKHMPVRFTQKDKVQAGGAAAGGASAERSGASTGGGRVCEARPIAQSRDADS
jgi:hypothetical protein